MLKILHTLPDSDFPAWSQRVVPAVSEQRESKGRGFSARLAAVGRDR